MCLIGMKPKKGKELVGGEERRRGRLEVGSCLKVAAKLPEDVDVVVVLDSGAGVSIVGERYIKKYREKFGEMEVKKIELKVAGVFSGATLSVQGATTFPLIFEGAKAPTLVTAVVVPEWSGEVLLGWRTLRNLGIQLAPDEPGKPVVVRLSKIGAEMEGIEMPQDKEILAAEALGSSVDKEMRKLEKRHENKIRKELKKRNKEKLTRGGGERERWHRDTSQERRKGGNTRKGRWRGEKRYTGGDERRGGRRNNGGGNVKRNRRGTRKKLHRKLQGSYRWGQTQWMETQQQDGRSRKRDSPH